MNEDKIGIGGREDSLRMRNGILGYAAKSIQASTAAKRVMSTLVWGP